MRPFLLALLLALAAPAVAQDRAATERRLEALQEQIAGVERQIQQARSEEQGQLAALEGLDTEIALREELVESLRMELDTLRTQAQAMQRSIQRLEQEINEARASYRRHARHAYMRGRTSDLALILSAGSIPQMIARARYLRQFAERRRRQVERIALKTDELRGQQAALTDAAQQTQRVITTSQFERQQLAERRRERAALVEEVRRRRGQLEGELAQRRADAQALEGLVRELVAEERRRAEAERRRQAEAARRAEEARLAESARRPVPSPSGTIPAPAPAPPSATNLPPVEDRAVALSGSFRSNRGRLPWPADGTVTGAFGTRTHPVYGTRIEEVGIDVTTAPGAGIRAVFQGTVERIASNPSYGTFVLVSHGGYTTMYGNLSQVLVRQGQAVQAGQALGRAGTAQQRRGPGVFFALFEGEQPVNPLPWLRSR